MRHPLFDDGGYRWEPEDYGEYFGVGGPGDGFMTSGPSPAPKPQAETSFLDEFFGSEDDEKPMVAQQGAAAAAAEQVVSNFEGADFQPPTPSGGGGGGGPISSGPIPGGSAPLASGSSKVSLPLLLGAAAGILFFVVKKW